MKKANSYIIKRIHLYDEEDIYIKELTVLQGLDDGYKRAVIIFDYLVDTDYWQFEASYQLADAIPDYDYIWYLRTYDEDENLIDTIKK
tara:strand:- start:602 stop:865 length:264 start_codon:yes stop_codon:yes gene_type:complete